MILVLNIPSSCKIVVSQEQFIGKNKATLSHACLWGIRQLELQEGSQLTGVGHTALGCAPQRREMGWAGSKLSCEDAVTAKPPLTHCSLVQLTPHWLRFSSLWAGQGTDDALHGLVSPRLFHRTRTNLFLSPSLPLASTPSLPPF